MKIRTLANEHPAVPRALAATAAAAILCVGAPASHAQETTRIVAAAVYPDSASVARELLVPGGTRHITIACVPEAVDVGTLQVDGDADARLGDVRATELPESRTDECAPLVAQARLDAIAQQRATLESQRDANELAFAFLKQWRGGAHVRAVGDVAQRRDRRQPAVSDRRSQLTGSRSTTTALPRSRWCRSTARPCSAASA